MEIPKIGEGKRGIEGHLLYLLRQANTVVQNAINQQLATFNLSLAQYSALTMIKAYEGISNAELARLSLLRPQSVNSIVLRLESDGLISRSSGHGRSINLSITKEGRELLAKARRRTDVIEKRIAKITGSATPELKKWLVAIANLEVD